MGMGTLQHAVWERAVECERWAAATQSETVRALRHAAAMAAVDPLQTVFAPSIQIEALRNLELLGCRLADGQGDLTAEGLCAFWSVVSFFFCWLCYLAGRVVSPLFFKCYSTLPKKEQREWDIRYSSMLHSFLCVWFAHLALWNSDFFYKESSTPHIMRTHKTTYSLLGMSWGYFIIDFIITLKYHMGGYEMLLHHVGSLSSVTAAIVTGHGHMHALWMLVTEFTTPFINFRWWLDKGGMKAHPFYFVNGICILLGWFLARILVFPPFFYVVYLQRDEVAYLHTPTRILLFVFPPILYMLNLMWFYKIVKGVIKLLKPKPKAKTQ